MQLISLLAVALLPVGLMAVPVTEVDETQISARDDGNEIFKRTDRLCYITGNNVNCRTGPKLSSSIKYVLKKDSLYWFRCVKSGDCVTVNGATNCGWDYAFDIGCYVNGHYTDSGCTLANLGRC